MRRSMSVAIVIVPVLASTLAAPQVRAADVPTTTTIVLAETPTYVGSYASYAAVVTPAPPSGSVVFEVTYDAGATWEHVSQGNVDPADGTASQTTSVGGELGTRLVRARYQPVFGNGYAESISANTIEQVVSKRPTSVSNFTVTGPGGGSRLVPGSSPIDLRVDVSGVAPSVNAQVIFEDDIDGAWMELGRAYINTVYGATPWAALQINALTEGSTRSGPHSRATNATSPPPRRSASTLPRPSSCRSSSASPRYRRTTPSS